MESPVISRYRTWYEHERDCDAKMLTMLESVPEDNRADPRFAQALQLADHLAACRENWLDRMAAGGANQRSWWPEGTKLEDLGPRFERIEAAWTEYLARIDDAELHRDFEFP